jgi:ankyrin repeat protein
VNAQGGEQGSALQAAALMGHDGIIKLLLEKGADVSVEAHQYGGGKQYVTGWLYK